MNKDENMTDYQELTGHRDLKVFQLAYKLAMEIFQISQAFCSLFSAFRILPFVF